MLYLERRIDVIKNEAIINLNTIIAERTKEE
jgi:hypothetical protein